MTTLRITLAAQDEPWLQIWNWPDMIEGTIPELFHADAWTKLIQNLYVSPKKDHGFPGEWTELGRGKAAGGWVKAWMSVPRAASLWNPSWQMCCFPPCLPLQLLLAYQVAPTLAESKKREVVNTAQQHANYNHLHPEDGGWQVYKREVERHGRSLWVTWNPASNMAN